MKQLEAEQTLRMFKQAIGEAKFQLVCNQVSALLGKLHIATTSKRWLCSDRGILTTTDGHKAFLPLNDWRGVLYKFAIQLDAKLEAMSSKEHKVELQCELPAMCKDAVDKIQLPSAQPALANP